MRFAAPLVRGRLLQRYKRFLADVALDGGETITAACPNTGSMLGLTAPGAAIWLSESDSPTRKYRHTWELIEADVGRGPVLVGINASRPNGIVADALAGEAIAELTGYGSVRREVPYGAASRIDFLLEDGDRRAYVEVKNVHLSRKAGLAEFPDSVTARGLKHLEELAAMSAAGHRAVMLYLIQRSDAARFSFADDIDPAYAAAAARVAAAGVELIAYRCGVSPDAIAVDTRVPIVGVAAGGRETNSETKARPGRRRAR